MTPRSVVLLALICLCYGLSAVALNVTNHLDTLRLSAGQKSVFEEAIGALDANFDGHSLLFNSPRYSAWYAVGLLARNEKDDVETASNLIRNAIDFQFKDRTKLWYGTFKNDPNAPDPGPLYPPKIYDSYDPNNALFVTTSWIIVIEEFHHLLDSKLVTLMKESMYNATVGDGYRVGGVDMDNLFPIYSNPWYMRVMSATYVGNMMGDKNMTMWGDIWAREAIGEFESFDTLSEFNSGTYTGVTLYALSLWGYMPKNSVIAKKAPEVIRKIWEIQIGELYNPSLETLGGPWDRAYGVEMMKYFAILGAQITGLIRDGDSGGMCVKEPIPEPLIGSEHFSDAAAALLTTLVSKFHDPHVPTSVVSRLKQKNILSGRLTKVQALSPPFDNVPFPRNYTSWNAEGISVGGIEFDMAFVGGASVNPMQFAPGMLLWRALLGDGIGDGIVGWLSHYVTSSSVSARATGHNLTITYPPSRAFPDTWTPSNVLTLLVSGFPGYTLDLGFGESDTVFDLPGVRLQFSGNVAREARRELSYGDGVLNGLVYYNLTYVMPEDLGGVPELVVGFEKM